MMNDTYYLVVLDTDKVKNYVFATNDLKEIRGASGLLDDLNLKQMERELVNGGYGTKNQEWCVIYLAGGGAKVLFKVKVHAEKFVNKIEQKYHLLTITGSITGIVYEQSLAEQDLGQGFDKHILSAEKQLRRKKDQRPSSTYVAVNPHVKLCQSCATLPAAFLDKKHKLDKKPKHVCKACHQKREFSRQGKFEIVGRFHKYLQDSVEQALQEKAKRWISIFDECNEKYGSLLPDDLSELGEYSKPENYIGFIYADANRMGERLAKKKTESEFVELSNKIKDGLQDSLFEAIIEHVPTPTSRKFPVEFILMGGDDVMVITPVQHVIDVALSFCMRFEKKTGVSISAGVALAHCNYPIYSFVELAEQLLRSAKHLSNDLRGSKDVEVSTIDFSVLSSSATKPLSEQRREEFRKDGNNVNLTMRPYKVTDMKDIMIHAIRDFKSKGVPTSKLQAMNRVLHCMAVRDQATIDMLYLRARLGTNVKEKARGSFEKFVRECEISEKFPWRTNGADEHTTPLIDLIELYDFIQARGNHE